MSDAGSEEPSRQRAGLGALPGASLFRKLARAFSSPSGSADPLGSVERALAERPAAHIRVVGAPDWTRQAVERPLAPAELTYGLREPTRKVDFVAVTVWAQANEVRAAAALAARQGAPVLSLRPSPFALSPASGPASFTLSPEPDWDAAWPATEIERLLNGPGDVQTDEDRAKARAVIDRFRELAQPASEEPGGRPILLLVDQPLMPIRDARVLVSDMTFKRMIAYAAERADCDVHVALSPAPRSYLKAPRLARFLENRIAPERLFLHTGEAAREALLARAETVLVATDDAGFRSLTLGAKVVCFGAAPFAGWGLTDDRILLARRRRARTLDDLVHLNVMRFGRHRAADGGPTDVDAFLRARQTALAAAPQEPEVAPAARPVERVLMVLPGSRHGATARHVETLSASLARQGAAVMVLVEGRPGPDGAGVQWRALEFAGRRMAPALRKSIVAFDPEVIHLFGSRTKPQRVALEAMVLSDAALVVQVEDEDAFIYASRNRVTADNLTRLDRPTIDAADVAAFMAGNDWSHTLGVLDDPEFDRWVEPVLRAICFRLAAGVTAIWTPLADRLAHDFGRPTLVLPPSVPTEDFARTPPAPETRAATLAKYGLAPDSLVFFTGGRTYGYSDAFPLFIRALNRLREDTGARLSLVVTGVETEHAVRAARAGLSPEIGFADLGRSTDRDYLAMLEACDVVCSPGADDPFDEFRLPSRLTRAMAWGKPILTSNSGFGRSLCHGENAILMEGDDPAVWAERMRPLLDPAARRAIADAGQDFARRHFEAERVAAELGGFLAGLVAARKSEGGGMSGLDLGEAATPRVSSGGVCDFEVAFDVLTRRGVWSLKTVVLIGARHAGDLQEWARFGPQRLIVVTADEAAIDPADYAAEPRVTFVTSEALREAGALAEGGRRTLSLRAALGHIAETHGLTGRAGNALAAFAPDPEFCRFDLAPSRVARDFEWAVLAFPRALAADLAPETAAFAAAPGVVKETPKLTFGEAVVNEVYRLAAP